MSEDMALLRHQNGEDPSRPALGIPGYLADQKFLGRPGSVACPDCFSTASHVYDSRHRNGTVARRRVCVNGHRFSTNENIPSTQGMEDIVQTLAVLSPSDFRLVCELADRLAGER